MSRRLLTCVLLVISVTAVFANSESLPDEVVVIETPAVEEVIVVRESPVVAAAEEYAVEHVPSEIADVEPLGIVAITTDDEEKVVTSETAFLLIEPTATTAAVLSSPIPIPTTPIPTSGVDAAAVALVLLFIAIAATWRSLAALGDAQFDNEFYQKGVYSVRWLTESLGTLTLAFYFGVTAVAELFEMRGLVTIIKTLASSFFYVRLFPVRVRVGLTLTHTKQSLFAPKSIPPPPPLLPLPSSTWRSSGASSAMPSSRRKHTPDMPSPSCVRRVPPYTVAFLRDASSDHACC